MVIVQHAFGMTSQDAAAAEAHCRMLAEHTNNIYKDLIVRVQVTGLCSPERRRQFVIGVCC